MEEAVVVVGREGWPCRPATGGANQKEIPLLVFFFHRYCAKQREERGEGGGRRGGGECGVGWGEIGGGGCRKMCEITVFWEHAKGTGGGGGCSGIYSWERGGSQPRVNSIGVGAEEAEEDKG